MITYWKAYQLEFSLVSPMHIGWRKVQNLQQTRRYVPAQTMWGAMTAALTRLNGESNYRQVGEAVDSSLRFSYFYLTDDNSVDLSVGKPDYWPWEDKKGGDFDWKYLNSYAGSPIDAGKKTTKEGGLHETEYIMPYSRTGNSVFLRGHIFESTGPNGDSKLIERWEEALQRLQLGGERSYGWGRVKLQNINNCTDCFGAELELCDSAGPIIKLPGDAYLPAHSLEKNCSSLKGKLELLTGRHTTDAKVFGSNFQNSLTCWVPGSKCLKTMDFTIGKRGVLKECRYPE